MGPCSFKFGFACGRMRIKLYLHDCTSSRLLHRLELFFSGKYARVRNAPMKHSMVTFRSSIETRFISQSQECSVWRTQYHCWLCKMRLAGKNINNILSNEAGMQMNRLPDANHVGRDPHATVWPVHGRTWSNEKVTFVIRSWFNFKIPSLFKGRD